MGLVTVVRVIDVVVAWTGRLVTVVPTVAGELVKTLVDRITEVGGVARLVLVTAGERV